MADLSVRQNGISKYPGTSSPKNQPAQIPPAVCNLPKSPPTDKQVDALVYELYGLTAAEIGIVEAGI